MRLHRTGIVALLAASVGSLGIAQGAAQAAHIRPILTTFGSFVHPSNVAVDQSNGNVFAPDGATAEVIDVFGANGGAPSGGLPTQITGAETPAGQFKFDYEPFIGVAVDNSGGPSNGDLYVSDTDDNAVDKFKLGSSHKYEYECQFTGFGGISGSACRKNEPSIEALPGTSFTEPLDVAIDSHGNVYITDFRSGSLTEFNDEGEEIEHYTSPLTERPEGIAVDNAGDIYLQDDSYGKLIELVRNPAGEVTSEQELRSSGTSNVATDHATGNLFVDLGNRIQELDATHELVSESDNLTFGGSSGLAIDEVSESVYVLDGEHTRIVELGTSVLLPDLSTETAGELTQTTATVSGTVDPDETPTTYYFQYGTSTAYGQQTPATSAGIGSTPEIVSAGLTGLTSLTTYHYRLVAENANGVNYGEDETFATPPFKPSLEGSPTALVTRTTAMISQPIDTDRVPLTVRAEFVLAAEYEPGAANPYVRGSSSTETDVPGAATTQPARVALNGLEPGTTYDYRLIATNESGTTISGNYTVTTAAPTPPAVGTGAVVTVAQTSATISGTVAPQGLQTSYAFELGTDTSYTGAKLFGNAGLSNGTEAVVIDLQDLIPGVTYHYRLAATNEDGTTYGEDRQFTTLAAEASILAPLTPPLIATPAISFPKVTGVTTVKSLTKAQKLAAALKACKGLAKNKRAKCRANAQKKYGAKVKSKKTKK